MTRAPALPDLESLRALVAVAETGSLTAAHSRLGISQQAVSLRVRGLEQSIGMPLLVRSTRGSALTPAGELAVEWAVTLLAAAEAFSAAVGTLQHDRQREFRIAASLTVAEHLIPHWLSLWHLGPTTPDVQLTAVNSGAVIDLVRRGEADLGFIETPDIPSDLNTAVVGQDQLIVVTAPAHPWSGREDVTAAELASTKLLWREEGSGTRRALERALRDAGIESVAPPAAVIPSALGIRTTAAAGYAPAVLSALAVRDDVRSGRLARIRFDGLDLRRPLTAIWTGEPTTDATRLLQIVAGEHSGDDQP